MKQYKTPVGKLTDKFVIAKPSYRYVNDGIIYFTLTFTGEAKKEMYTLCRELQENAGQTFPDADEAQSASYYFEDDSLCVKFKAHLGKTALPRYFKYNEEIAIPDVQQGDELEVMFYPSNWNNSTYGYGVTLVPSALNIVKTCSPFRE